MRSYFIKSVSLTSKKWLYNSILTMAVSPGRKTVSPILVHFSATLGWLYNYKYKDKGQSKKLYVLKFVTSSYSLI